MKVVITGGTGFLGLRLAVRLREIGSLIAPSGSREPIDDLVLFDSTAPDGLPTGLADGVSVRLGDIADATDVAQVIDRDDISVFHLASVVSSGAEQDFDLAMAVNVDGGRNVLEACRTRAGRPRVLFASSIAVFGGSGMPAVVGDHAKQTPRTTYGMTKAVGELLVNDYTRKGYLDGRTARLPTVIVRPGAPNLAASSFVSGLFREPLAGLPIALPVATDTVMPVLGTRSIIEGLIRLHDLDGDRLGDDRAVSLPSHTVTVADMIDALGRVAGDRPLGEITVDIDPAIESIVAGWARDVDHTRATALGLPKEASLDEIVAAYIEDHLDAGGQN